jgi:mRNA-degrading endonuclease RelE of RelBE toxin-antitoxin system
MSFRVYEVVFKKSAAKELQDLPQKIQQKILDAVQLLSLNPYTELLQSDFMDEPVAEPKPQS